MYNCLQLLDISLKQIEKKKKYLTIEIEIHAKLAWKLMTEEKNHIKFP